jgi:hypothetical protein
MSLTNHNDFLVMQGSEITPGNSGIWRTTDGGTTWAKATGLPSNFNGGAWVHFHQSWLEHGGPDHPNNRYAFSQDTGFYRSTDGGSSWSQTGVAQPGTTWAYGMAVDQAPGRNGAIWLAHDSDSFTLKRSTDQGVSWQTVGGFSRAKRVSAYDGRVAVWGKRTADTEWRLYYSANNGVDWTAHTDSTDQRVANSIRYGHSNNVHVDPYRIGKVWLTGLTSVHVVDAAPDADPVITSAATATGVSGSSFSYTITATSTPAASMTYEATGLPTGLSLSGAVISGTLPTVTTSTSYSITLKATGAYRTSAPVTLVLTVTPASTASYKVRFHPRSGQQARMLNGKIQGSNTSSTSGFVDLATITTTPGAAWTTMDIGSTRYRYLRYMSPAAPAVSFCNIAELEFYNGTTRITGTGFGTAGSYNSNGNTFVKALDGLTTTHFDAPTASGGYVGLDIGTP